MSARRYLLLTLLLVIGLVMAACGTDPAEDSTADSATEEAADDAAGDEDSDDGEDATATEGADSGEASATGETIQIGMIMSLTGSAASAGIGLANAEQLAVDLINEDGGVVIDGTAHELELLPYDDQGTAEGGIAAITKMFEQDGVDLEVGTIASSVAVGLLPFMQRHTEDLAMIFTGASAAELTEPPNAFRMAIAAPNVQRAHAAYAAEQGWTSAVDIIDSTNAGQVSASDGWFAELEENGVELLASESVERGQTDFTSVITRIMSLEPDFVELRLFPDETVTFVRQSRELGWDVPFLVVSNITPDQAEGALSADQLTSVHQAGWATIQDLISAEVDGAQELSDAYIEAFGEEPGFLTMQGFEGINSMAAAMEQAGSSEPADVIEALTCLEPYERMIWPIGLSDEGCVFAPGGETGVPIAVAVWTDGELEFQGLL